MTREPGMEGDDARVRRIVREEINRFRRRVMLCAWALFFVMLTVGLVIHSTEVVGLAEFADGQAEAGFIGRDRHVQPVLHALHRGQGAGRFVYHVLIHRRRPRGGVRPDEHGLGEAPRPRREPVR